MSFQYNFIAIEGNIGAGKSSLAGMIARDFNAKLILEQFEDNSFLPKFYENPQRYSFSVELTFLAERYQQLKNHLSNQELFSDFTISDYFIWKSQIFASKTLEPDEFTLFTKVFNIIEPILPKPDLLVYLYMDIDRLIHNIRKRERQYEQNIQADYLARIQQGYLDFFRQQMNMRILILDMDGINFVERKADYKKIVEILTEKYDPGIHRLLLK